MSGWRRNADRTRLRANSLVSGNSTGNFAILGLRDTITCQETAALRPLLEQFPTQIIGEKYFGEQRISKRYQGFTTQETEHPSRCPIVLQTADVRGASNVRCAPLAAVPSVICCLNASDLVDTAQLPRPCAKHKTSNRRLGSYEKVNPARPEST